MQKLLVLDSSVAALLPPIGAPSGELDRLRLPLVQRLLEPTSLNPEKWRLALPLPSLTEVLGGIAKKDHDLVIDWFKARVDFLDVDLKVATIAGQMASREAYRMRQENRQCFKYDALISAAAVRWHAGGLCYYDGDHKMLMGMAGHQVVTGEPKVFLDPGQVPLPIKQ